MVLYLLLEFEARIPSPRSVIPHLTLHHASRAQTHALSSPYNEVPIPIMYLHITRPIRRLSCINMAPSSIPHAPRVPPPPPPNPPQDTQQHNTQALPKHASNKGSLSYNDSPFQRVNCRPLNIHPQPFPRSPTPDPIPSHFCALPTYPQPLPPHSVHL
jgi:hypothetical protein